MWPSKDEITQKLVENIIGANKKFNDLQDSWFTKHLIIALREAVWVLLLLVKRVYDNTTVKGSSKTDLDDKGYDFGVDRNQATKAQHMVSLRKSLPVKIETPVPDNFLLTTTPVQNQPPVKFTVVSGQNKSIGIGEQSVEVVVECTEYGEIGNVSDGSINLVAQAGFDSVVDSRIYKKAVETESDDAYRKRILVRKRTPIRGGVPADYERWAMEVSGVTKARAFRIARGPGTVDVVIWGEGGGIPSDGLIDECQKHIDSVTPADIANGGVVVCAPEEILVDVVLSNVSSKQGYTEEDIIKNLERAYMEFFQSDKATDFVTIVDCVVTVRTAYDINDTALSPIINNFTLVEPSMDIPLSGRQSPVLNSITINP